MKIVIAGAGDVGFHLASLLASEHHDIVLLDTNRDVLEYASTHLDVLALEGDATSITSLEKADIRRAEMFLAVTTSESSNIVSCIIAKKMGVPHTVARVKNEEYLEDAQRLAFNELGVDRLFSPVKLATQEIERLVQLCEVTDNFEFEGGKIDLIGVTLDDSSSFVNKTIKEIDFQHPELVFRPIAILRGHDTIIPRSGTVLKRSDHVYFITQKKDVEKLLKIIGKELTKIKKVMILGGTELALRTAKVLEKNYQVSIVDNDKTRCKILTQSLNRSLVIKGDPSNIELLREEGLKEIDAFIALTPNAEINIITSLMAENEGVFKTIASVDNSVYTHISQNIGVDTLINKKLIAANNVFRYVRKGKVEAITSLHGVRAEIIEYIVPEGAIITKVKLRELKFPAQALIGGVIRDEATIIPDGNFQLIPDDKVIVFAMPEAISKVESLFLTK
jgi:trk system potassium uptake protein TrkA